MRCHCLLIRWSPTLVAGAVLALHVCCAGAEVGEGIYFSDLPVVASVSRLPQRQADAPTAVTVLDRALIKASGARDLNDLFRLVPGFQTYPNNTDPARVTYHGLTDEDFSPRVQVLIDGRSQYSPLFRNGINWATLPVAIEDIERIEVVRGSNSASYGSNAFLGVINIITVDPSLVRNFSVSANHGNQGVRDYTLRNGGKLGAAGDFRFTYQQKDDGGLTDRADWKDSFRSRLFDLRADFTVSDRDLLQFSAGHVEALTQLGRLRRSGEVLVGGDDPTNPLRDFAQSNSSLQLTWRRALASDEDFQLRYAYVADWASEKHLELRTDLSWNGSKALQYAIDSLGGRGTRHEIEAQHTLSPLRQTRLVWGGSYRRDSLQATEYLYGGGTVDRRVGRIFGNLEWKPATWFTGNAGLSAEEDSLAGFNMSPRASGSFHITPQNTLRFGYARARRTLSSVDYVGDRRTSPHATETGTPIPLGLVFRRSFLGDPNLEAERLESFELGYLGDWKEWRMSLDVRLFQEKIPNRMMIIARRMTDPALCDVLAYPGSCALNAQTKGNTMTKADMMMPIQKVRIEGIEYQWRWQPFEPTRLLLNQAFTRVHGDYLSAAFNDPLNVTFDSETNPRNIDQLTDRSVPRYSTSLLLMQRLPYGFEFSVAGYWQDRMKWTRNSESYKYNRQDARLAYPFRWGRQGGELSYTVQSLNGAHGEFKASGLWTDRVVERRHWVGLRLDF